MPYSNNIMTAIEAAIDHNIDDEYLMDDIASHLRPLLGTLAEDRIVGFEGGRDLGS